MTEHTMQNIPSVSEYKYLTNTLDLYHHSHQKYICNQVIKKSNVCRLFVYGMNSFPVTLTAAT